MGYGYDESDSFIDNSEAVSAAGAVRGAKGAAWEAELHWERARRGPGPGDQSSWGSCVPGDAGRNSRVSLGEHKLLSVMT